MRMSNRRRMFNRVKSQIDGWNGEQTMLIGKTVNVFGHAKLTARLVIRGIIRLDVNDRCPVQYIKSS